MIQIEFQRNLIGQEDILFGFGTVNQIRGKTPVTVTKLNSSVIPYSAEQSLHDKFVELETAIDSKMVIDGAGNILTGLIESTTSDISGSMPGRLWIKEITSTESHLYHGDELVLKFNPDGGNLIFETSLEAYIAADAVVTSAFQAADTELENSLTIAYQNADAALDEALTEAYQAADDALQEAITTAYQEAIAALPVPGTSEGNIVQLLAGGKLPAVDGSNLTNLPLSYDSLEAKLGFGQYAQSADYTFTHGSNQYFAHGFGKTPRFGEIELICVTADGGYSPGDILKPRLGATPSGGGFSLWYNETHYGYGVYYYGASNPQVTKTGGVFSPKAANWKIRVKVWA